MHVPSNKFNPIERIKRENHTHEMSKQPAKDQFIMTIYNSKIYSGTDEKKIIYNNSKQQLNFIILLLGEPIQRLITHSSTKW